MEKVTCLLIVMNIPVGRHKTSEDWNQQLWIGRAVDVWNDSVANRSGSNSEN